MSRIGQGLATLFLLLLLATSGALVVARQSCSSCTPAPISGVNTLSGNFLVCVDDTFIEQERNDLKYGIENYWPSIMANTGAPITFEVVFAADEPEHLCGPYGADIIVNSAS